MYIRRRQDKQWFTNFTKRKKVTFASPSLTLISHKCSSTDLGFDEPPLPSRRTGTLSSSDTTTISSFKQVSEPEEDYVNLQYFLQHNQRRRANTGDSQSSPLPAMTPPVMFQSDDELDMDDEEEDMEEEPPVIQVCHGFHFVKGTSCWAVSSLFSSPFPKHFRKLYIFIFFFEKLRTLFIFCLHTMSSVAIWH